MACECCPYKTLFEREVELRTENRVESIRLTKELDETHKKYKDLVHKWKDLVAKYNENVEQYNEIYL